MKCSVCNGLGGETEIVTDEGEGPYYECAYCDGKEKISIYKWVVWKLLLFKQDRKSCKGAGC